VPHRTLAKKPYFGHGQFRQKLPDSFFANAGKQASQLQRKVVCREICTSAAREEKKTIRQNRANHKPSNSILDSNTPAGLSLGMKAKPQGTLSQSFGRSSAANSCLYVSS